MDDVTMRLETENNQWVVKIEQAIIRSKKHALVVAKDLKKLARMLPDSTPRYRPKVEHGDEPTKSQRVKPPAKKKINADATTPAAEE